LFQGEVSKPVTARTLPASGLEGRETFHLSLVHASNGAVISPTHGTATIVIEADPSVSGTISVSPRTRDVVVGPHSVSSSNSNTSCSSMVVFVAVMRDRRLSCSCSCSRSSRGLTLTHGFCIARCTLIFQLAAPMLSHVSWALLKLLVLLLIS